MPPTERRPVIGFLTDFGLDGAAATCRAVMLSVCPDAQIVDISHTVPKYGIRDGAFILRSALPWFPIGVHVGVVDPGVGTARRPIAIRAARGDVLIGPDNGLLPPAADALGGISEARELTNRALWLPATTSTFHGRDIFSPVAGHLAAEAAFEAVGTPIPTADLVRLKQAVARVEKGAITTEVVYVDSFGNARLAGGESDLRRAFGAMAGGTSLTVTIEDRSDAVLDATYAPSFGHVGRGDHVVYVDSSGNLAIATNQGDVATAMGLRSGSVVHLSRPTERG